MKIIITRSTFIGGRLIEAAPYPVDVLDPIAKQLLALGKAVLAPELPSPPTHLPKGDGSVSAETHAEPSAPSEDSKAAEKKAKAEAKAAAKKAKAEAKAKAANPE